MTQQHHTNRQITDEAAQWAVALDAGALSAAQRRDLAGWLLASPQHVRELLLAASLLDAVGEVAADALPIDALLADTAPEIIPLLGQAGGGAVRTRRQGRHPALWMGGIAAAAVVALALSVAPSLFGDDRATIAFETRLGEQRRMTLDDGSVVHVNTQSAVRVRYAHDRRTVELVRGEALFDVAHDPARPFRVIAGEMVTEAIGTTFNVYRDGDSISVAVIAGKVAVATENDVIERLIEPAGDGRADTAPGVARAEDGRLVLSAGQRADLALATRSMDIAPAKVRAVQSWRLGQLVFERETLDRIAAQFNRYNRTRIEIADPRVAGMQVSGVFDTDDPDSLIAALDLLGGVAVDRSDPSVIRLSARD